MAFIKGKQLENTLRSETNPFTAIYCDDVIGDLNGAIRFTAQNTSGGTINKGEAVYVTGVSGDEKPTVSLAQANSNTTMPAFGLAMENINNNATGEIVTFGNLTGVSTSAFTLTDTLYISADNAGALVCDPPTGSNNLIQNIGKVTRVHASGGTIKVGGAGRTNATPNLDEGHFFLGNASNQSSQSSYQLPTSIGTNGQVLTSNGTDVTFQDASGGTSITTERVSSGSTINATVNYRYIIDTFTLNWTLNLPTSPSVGDAVYVFARYYASITIQTTDSINISRAGWYTEPHTTAFPLNSGVQIMIIYNGSDWLVESPDGEVRELTSQNINETSFKRYDTIFWPYTNHTCTLPAASTIPEGVYVDIVFVTHNSSKYGSGDYVPRTVTFNAASSANELINVGFTNDASPVSSLVMNLPKVLKIIKYNGYLYIINPAEYPFKTYRPGDIFTTRYVTNTTYTAYQNVHYYMNSSSTARTVTLPDIADLEYGDQIKFSLLTKVNDPEPASFTLSLSSTDAAGSVYLTSRGYQRYSTSFDTVTLPLTTGTVIVSKVTDTEYDVELTQTGSGVIETLTTTSESLLPGFTYLIDSGTAAGTTTLTLPVADSSLIGSQINIKIIDNTYDIIIDGYSSNTIDEVASITCSANTSLNRCISLQAKADSKWMVVQDTGSPIVYLSEITATTTLSAPNYGVKELTHTVNHATNAITVTLPAVASVPIGFKYNFKRIGAGTVSIAGSGTEYIDYSGQTSISVTSQYDNVVLQNTGSFWLILN